MKNLPSFHPFFVLKLEVRALLQNVCNGICGIVASKIFLGEDSPRHPYDSRTFSARSRTNYFKLATPLDRKLITTCGKTKYCNDLGRQNIKTSNIDMNTENVYCKSMVRNLVEFTSYTRMQQGQFSQIPSNS